jgi:hypothetical protein
MKNMKKHLMWFLGALLIFSATMISWRSVGTAKPTTSITSIKTAEVSAKALLEQYVSNVYRTAHLQESGLDLGVFQKAFTGFLNLKIANKLPQNSSILTVVDLSKPSHEKRMWIVDIATKALLLNTWVAHGQGSGDDIASHFSNNNESHQSSLGFYLTDDIYFGKHGRSLRLDGMDEGFNSGARSRDIVVHAAPYVSQQNINVQGRIGRSFGCPAVSPEVSDLVINTIKGKTVLFINGNDSSYTSKYLNDENLPKTLFMPDSSATMANAGIANDSIGK